MFQNSKNIFIIILSLNQSIFTASTSNAENFSPDGFHPRRLNSQAPGVNWRRQAKNVAGREPRKARSADCGSAEPEPPEWAAKQLPFQ